MSPFAQAAARAAAASPHTGQAVVPGRVLLADGDGLAYACAGNDETPPGKARARLVERLTAAQAGAGASAAMVALTAPQSPKGGRFAIARVKPYQGNRSKSRRPKNWPHLRDVLTSGSPGFPTMLTAEQEADDLFATVSANGPENLVIYTEDKDMRMVPGWHLHWTTYDLHYVPPGTWCIERNGLVYGRKWFWLQMLQGDAADHIPGLPFTMSKSGKMVKCGEVTAGKLLEKCADEHMAIEAVSLEYHILYGDMWKTHMLEQACLLWMQRTNNVLDCMYEGGPMAFANTAGWREAAETMLSRIAAAKEALRAATQGV